jgi:hypothetical protein
MEYEIPSCCSVPERKLVCYVSAGDRRRTAGGSTSLRDCRVLYLDSASRIEAWNSGTSINGGCRQARTRTRVCLNWSGPFDERQNCLAWSRLLSVQAGLHTATVMAKCLGIRLVNLDSQWNKVDVWIEHKFAVLPRNTLYIVGILVSSPSLKDGEAMRARLSCRTTCTYISGSTISFHTSMRLFLCLA